MIKIFFECTSLSPDVPLSILFCLCFRFILLRGTPLLANTSIVTEISVEFCIRTSVITSMFTMNCI